MKKYNLKHRIALFLAGCLLVGSLSGCGKKKDNEPDDTTVIPIDTATDGDPTDEASTEDNSTESTAVMPSGFSAYAMETPTSDEAVAEQARFDEYLDESFRESVVTDTVTLHYMLGYPEQLGIERPEPTYGEVDFTDEALAEELEEIKEDKTELEEYNYDLLTREQKILYDMLEENIELSTESYDFVYMSEPFAYTSGVHSNMPILLAEYRFYTKQDVDDYIGLLKATPDYYNELLEFEKEKSKRGLFMNSHNANEVIRQCKELMETDDNSMLILTFNSRIDAMEDLTDEEKESYKQANKDAIENYYIPAYSNVVKTFSELKNTGKNENGLAGYEDGQDYYRYLIKNTVGSDRTPEEIIELLDEELDAALEELQKLAFANYTSYSSYAECYETLYDGLELEPTIAKLQEKIKGRFPEIPEVHYTATPVHESLKDVVSPAFYIVPPLDDYTDNVIHTNLGDDTSNTLWSTLAHEGMPGHMYQSVYFLSSKPYMLRSLLDYKGYTEGWATYIELMSYALYDGYEDPVYADFERLNSTLNLLVSARIEIGVNYEGWTLEETSSYLTGMGFDGSAADTIYNYVIAEPANYQMYVLGYLEFKTLREKCEDLLGDKFDEQEFHKQILDAGPCSFGMLNVLIDDYIMENE